MLRKIKDAANSVDGAFSQIKSSTFICENAFGQSEISCCLMGGLRNFLRAEWPQSERHRLSVPSTRGRKMRKQHRGLVYLNEEWQGWLADNLASGCQPDDLQRLLIQAGFAPSVARAVLSQGMPERLETRQLPLDVSQGNQIACSMHQSSSAQCDACWLQARDGNGNATFFPQQSFALH